MKVRAAILSAALLASGCASIDDIHYSAIAVDNKPHTVTVHLSAWSTTALGSPCKGICPSPIPFSNYTERLHRPGLSSLMRVEADLWCQLKEGRRAAEHSWQWCSKTVALHCFVFARRYPCVREEELADLSSLQGYHLVPDRLNGR